MAIVLRVWNIGHGLPDLTEEAFPFRHAITLWGATGRDIDLNPHWFAYPSLSIYVQFIVQQVLVHVGGHATPADFLLALARDPTHAVIAGRSVGVLADVLTIILVWRICRRFGRLPAILAMVLVASSEALIETSRLIYADSVMCAFSIAAIERLVSYYDRGGQVRLFAAAALVGLAIGTKYPAAVLLIPLGLVAWRRRGPRLHSVVSVALALGVFILTTPYLLVSWSEFTRDLVYMTDTSTRGGLGRVEGTGLAFCMGKLVQNLGWLGLGLLAMSLWVVIRRRCGGVGGVLWLTWALLLLPIAAVPVEASRYLVATIAVSSCLIAAGLASLVERGRSEHRSLVTIGLVVLCALQPAWAGIASAMRGSSTTQRDARLWCEANLLDSDLILTEAYGPYLLSHGKRAEVMAGPLYQAAGSRTQVAYSAQRAFHIVNMPLLVGGFASVRMPTADAQIVNVYPHAVDWNAAAYDLRLLRGVDYFVTSSAVRGRFELDRARFHEQVRFYSFLDSLAESVAEFTSSSRVQGPSIKVYRMTTQARVALAGLGELDSLWWARLVPARFRTLADSLLRAELASSDLIPGLPPWLLPLRDSYQQRYAPFASDLAQNLAAVGETGVAERVLTASLTTLPEDIETIRLYALIAGSLGKWTDVERALERSSLVLARYGEVPGYVLLMRMEVLLRIGNRSEAARVAQDLFGRNDPALADAARALLLRIASSN